MHYLQGVSASVYFFLIPLLAGSAFANSQVTMQFLGHGDTNKNPVYPWYVQVNGVSATLICDILNNLNVKGETGQANVTNILNGPTEELFKGNTLLDYRAAAIIFSDILFPRGQCQRCQLGDLGVHPEREEQ